MDADTTPRPDSGARARFDGAASVTDNDLLMAGWVCLALSLSLVAASLFLMLAP